MANLIWLISALLLPLAWLIPLALGHGEAMSPGLVALTSGLAVVGAAFLLSWGCELAEEDVPPSFALIVLALVAVLPEFAVDLHFAWEAGLGREGYLEYAVANMTGSNRLLLGVGWSVLVFVLWARNRERVLHVAPEQRLELGFLLLATLYSFVLPLKASISLVDSAVFFAIFGLYVARSLKLEHDAHDLVGPARWIDERIGGLGRWVTILIFLAYACAAIWFSANHFADGLVALGRDVRIDEFILIQLVAPIATESPEFIVAILFVIRHRPSTAMAVLVSSKVSQWTLLIGALPIAYTVARWTSGATEPPAVEAMPLDSRQAAELLLTSGQSLFGVAILADLRFTLLEAILLAGLFGAQWFFQGNVGRYAFAVTYLVLVLLVGFRPKAKRDGLLRLLRLGK